MSDDAERERAKYEALAALVDGYRRERDEARDDFAFAMRKMDEQIAIIADTAKERDEARAEVERLRAEADRWKRSCNVFRERDWPKAFQATVTSLEQEVSDAYEQLAKLHKLSKPWEGGAYRRGAEAMREACAGVIDAAEDDARPCVRVSELADTIRALPIPEEP